MDNPSMELIATDGIALNGGNDNTELLLKDGVLTTSANIIPKTGLEDIGTFTSNFRAIYAKSFNGTSKEAYSTKNIIGNTSDNSIRIMVQTGVNLQSEGGEQTVDRSLASTKSWTMLTSKEITQVNSVKVKKDNKSDYVDYEIITEGIPVANKSVLCTINTLFSTASIQSSVNFKFADTDTNFVAGGKISWIYMVSSLITSQLKLSW